MGTLYEIDQRLTQLEEWGCDPETGEILSDEDFANKFDEISMELDKKIENTMLFAKQLNSDAEAIKAEEKALSDRRKRKEAFANRLTANIDRYIRHICSDEDGNVDEAKLNKYRFETPKIEIKYRKSNKVVVTDINKIPSKFIKTTTTVEPDKAGLKTYLKDNGCDGAEIQQFYNMQVK